MSINFDIIVDNGIIYHNKNEVYDEDVAVKCDRCARILFTQDSFMHYNNFDICLECVSEYRTRRKERFDNPNILTRMEQRIFNQKENENENEDKKQVITLMVQRMFNKNYNYL